MYGIRVMKWDISEAAPNGLITEEPWPKPHQVAVCRLSSRTQNHDPESVPDEDCTCGVYALRALWMTDLYARQILCQRYFDLRQVMFATLVKGYGKVILHETGWRAASAEVLGVCSLWRDPPSQKVVFRTVSAASFYQVPVLNSWEVIQILKGTTREYRRDIATEGDDHAPVA